MSTISLLTILFFLSSSPTYTEVFRDGDMFFYRQKNNFYSVTNIANGKKTIGIKTRWGNCYIRIFSINPEKLRLAVDGLEEVKREAAQNKFDAENYKYYENILDNPLGHDSLSYTFLCWRTSYQISNYGVSNYSCIPNNFYNRKKGKVINKLKIYLKSHPGSVKAAAEIAYLETLSDIVRGGFMGSSVLNDLGFLSGDRD